MRPSTAAIGCRTAAAAIAVLAMTAIIWTPSTGAQTESRFTAVADARLASANFTFQPALIFDQLVDAGGAVAQAELSSLGDSVAFASNPYPSGSVISLPATSAGLTEGATSGLVPEYPLIASSSHPSRPDSEVGIGPAILGAHSRADSSSATSRDGSNTGNASVEYDAASGEVRAKGEVQVGSVGLSDLLSIDGIRSVATATQTPDGDIQLDSSFDVGIVRVAGQRLPLSLLEDAGVASALPTVGALLLDQLADRGITIELLPEERNADSITSAGLRITMVTDMPEMPPLPPLPDLGLPTMPLLPAILALPGGVSGLDTAVTEIVLGRTSARVENAALPTFDFDGAPGGVAPGAAAFPSSPSDLGSEDASTAIAPSTDSSNPPTGRVPAAVTATARLIADISVASFYPVLLAAALACVGTAVLIGKLGVRDP